MTTIIPVFFTFDSNYVLAAKVAIHSMLRYASSAYQYELYILHTTLSESDCRNLSSAIKEFTHANMNFINVSEYEKKISGLNGKAHYSKEIFYKLIAADIFPQYQRILCTDVDVVFTGDISEAFFLYPDEDFIYAGVGPTNNDGRMPKYKGKFTNEEIEILEHEIGAGFLLLNLDSIRKHNKQQEMTDFYINNYNRLLLPEQDCMILTCWPLVRYIHTRFVVITAFYDIDISKFEFYKGTPEFNCSREEAARRFKKALQEPVQIHYAGPDKPWNSIMVRKHNEWLKAMYKAGCTTEYIMSQPKFMINKLKKYSLKRFIGKMMKKVNLLIYMI